MVKFIQRSQKFERFFMKILKWIVLYDTRDFSLNYSHITFICLVYKLKLSDFVHVRSVTEKKKKNDNEPLKELIYLSFSYCKKQYFTIK